MHPATEAILKFFAWEHLPPHLQAVSRPIGELAQTMAETLPPGPEVTSGLRKLLEGKDCLVRAALDAPREGWPVKDSAVLREQINRPCADILGSVETTEAVKDGKVQPIRRIETTDCGKCAPCKARAAALDAPREG